MSKDFCHLHTHTEYSMLDGASRLDDLVQALVVDGQSACGITDHGNMYGAIPFYKTCKENGVKPIIGTEAYMAHDTRFERPATRGKMDDFGGVTEQGHKQYYHITLLAENAIGYKNLIQLSSRAFLEGYYYKPRVDWELLDSHSEGVIATSGCLGGHVLQALMHDGYDAALKKAGRLQDIFGKDNFFIELQDHGIQEQHETNPQLIRISKEIGAPILATNDSHYVTEDDAHAHDALLCVQVGSRMSDDDRFKFEGSGHYVKSAEEMYHLFREHPEACDNTLAIAERCELDIDFNEVHLPRFEIPEGFSDDREYLRHLTLEGAKARWGDKLPEAASDRLAYELKVIDDMGFNSYFLITWDLIKYAKRANIRTGPGRGSAAGCAVSYSLGITDIDPIKYDLLFERFLNPSRISMPDIDMDFDSRYRTNMIDYAAQKYGRDHVAQIITFSTIKARAAVRDAARVLDKPFALGDRIAKAMPPLIMGRDTPLAACFEEDPKYAEGYARASGLRSLFESDPEVREVVNIARGLEGLRRQDGIHAAAVVISPDPLTEYLPIQRKAKVDDNLEDVPIVTQYEMDTVESLGLLKMDFLGLKNLDVISETVDLIKYNYDIELDMSEIPLDDQKTFDLLQIGDTVGVFQLESPQMRSLMRLLHPETFDDIAALVALYRPGPMSANMHNDYADRKNGRAPVAYIHPDAEEILGDTYGLMIYQEQMMRMAQKFAGYSLAEADNLRKACGKKVRELMAKEREKFVEGVVETGYERELGDKLFSIIENFADYAFNKSHSYGYGLIAYQTAYLKANYAKEYFAALLTSASDHDGVAKFLYECRPHGITVTVPNINEAFSSFVPAKDRDEIIFGLESVRNVGEAVVEKIVAERKDNPYQSFQDFCERIDSTVLNKRIIESLIKAGAFDSFGYPRRGLLIIFEKIIKKIQRQRKKETDGAMDLFSSAGIKVVDETPVPDIEFDKVEKLAEERNMLGLYVSDHPLNGVEKDLRSQCDVSVGEIADLQDSDTFTVGGVLTNVEVKRTKRGQQMVVCRIEDLDDSIEAVIFPNIYGSVKEIVDAEGIVKINGELNLRDESPKVFIQGLKEFVPSDVEDFLMHVPQSLFYKNINNIYDVLEKHPGNSNVQFMISGGRGNRVVRLPDRYNVFVDKKLYSELRDLFLR